MANPSSSAAPYRLVRRTGVSARAEATAPILVTRRLSLRPLAENDLDALHAIQSDPEHMRYYPHPYSREETREWIERRIREIAERGHSLWAVQDRATGAFLGNVGPVVQTVDGVEEVELGWSITPERTRQGIASEAAAACRDWCWDHLEVDHLICLVRPENIPSRGVAERVGMHVWKETLFGSMGWRHLVYRLDRPGEVTTR
jgi:[ribosomal protein S5]-alanine N-acetyltransferase